MVNRGGRIKRLLSISALTSPLFTTLVIGSPDLVLKCLAAIGMSFLRDLSGGNVISSAEGLALVTVTLLGSTLECREELLVRNNGMTFVVIKKIGYSGCFPLCQTDRSETSGTIQGKMEGHCSKETKLPTVRKRSIYASNEISITLQ